MNAVLTPPDRTEEETAAPEAVLPPAKPAQAAGLAEPFYPLVISEYVRACPVVPPAMTCQELVKMFRSARALDCVVVCDDLRRPVGLVMKHGFFRTLGSLYGMSIYGEKPVEVLMDKQPLIQDEASDPQDIIDRALSRQEETFCDSVIVTRGGRLAGVLTISDLLHLSRLLQKEAANRQIRTVRATDGMLEEIHGAVARVAASSGLSRAFSDRIAGATRRGREEMEGMLGLFRSWAATAERQEAAVAELTERNASVHAIVKLIAELADQCNLLAVNATIEAARAGEHGRGFSVVAGEVRGLADRTKRSAQEIDRLLKGMLQAAGRAAELVKEGKAGADEGVRRVQRSEETFRLLWEAAEDNQSASRELLGASDEAGAISERIRASFRALIEELNGRARA